MTSTSSSEATGWPHQFHRHTLAFGTGYVPGSRPTEQQAIKLHLEGLKDITNEPEGVEGLEFFPNFSGQFTDSRKVIYVTNSLSS